MAEFRLNLHLFEGDGAGAGAAPAAAGEAGGQAAVTNGVLEDGTKMDNRLAARMEEQARKRRERGEEPVKPAAQMAAQKQPEQPQETEPSLDDQWNEAKKGKFKDQYARDVQAAIKDRFKNQEDANEKLAMLEPALKALARQRGIDEGNFDELAKDILNDDSLFEQEAEEHGMPVEAYRQMLEMQAENERLKAREAEEQEEMFLRQHFQNLAMQAEEMKKQFPGFDLRKEMENEAFRRLVAPNSGLNLHAAYYAIHHAELEPQAMAYGFQRAQNQMSQTLQANRARPVEGALKNGAPAANVAIDPKSMRREERQKLIERARRGEKIVF